MVFFTCNHCGDSLQKPRVEKHYAFVCKRVKSLTCVDCLKDFRGEEYAIHTKCITEEERYSAKGSIPGGIVKKGEIKQESWMEMLKTLVARENLRQPIRNLLNTMLTYSNIPRKKQKFINFMKSSSGGRVNINDVEEIWDIIEKYKEESKPVGKGDTGQVNGDEKFNGTNMGNISGEEAPKKTNLEVAEKSIGSESYFADVSENANAEDNEKSNENKSKKKKKKAGAEVNSNIDADDSKLDEINENKDNKKKKRKQVEVNDSALADVSENGYNGEENTKLVKKKKKKQLNCDEAVKYSEISSPTVENENLDKNVKMKKKLLSTDETEGNSKEMKVTEADNAKSEKIIENGTKDTNKKKKKKHTSDEAEAVDAKKIKLSESNETTPSETFDYVETILNILTSKGSISVKKLEKKVAQAYKAHTGETECSPKVMRKFHKKLRTIANLQVFEDKVSLKK